MKSIKALSLGLLAAAAVMALVGVSSASATSTQLCKTHVAEPCAVGNQISSLHLESKGNVVFEATFIVTIVVECKKALVQATVLGLGNPEIGHITAFSMEECTTGGNPCTVTTTNFGLYNILKTSLNLGFAEHVSWKTHLRCGEIIDCEYEANGKKIAVEGSGHTAGAGNGMFTAKKLPIDKVAGGFTCPNTSNLTALFEPLSKMFVLS